MRVPSRNMLVIKISVLLSKLPFLHRWHLIHHERINDVHIEFGQINSCMHTYSIIFEIQCKLSGNDEVQSSKEEAS